MKHGKTMTGSSGGRRQKRVAGLIQDEMSRLFIREVQPHVGALVTVTRVEMPADLRSAKVYLTVWGPADPEIVLESLRQRAGHFRRSIASAVNLKYNPQLFFVLDPVPAYESRIDELLTRTKKSREE
jgi:ribosome-binding factor A